MLLLGTKNQNNIIEIEQAWQVGGGQKENGYRNVVIFTNNTQYYY